MGFYLIYLTFMSGKYFFVGGSALDIILEKQLFLDTYGQIGESMRRQLQPDWVLKG